MIPQIDVSWSPWVARIHGTALTARIRCPAPLTPRERCHPGQLDLPAPPSQTNFMAHTYLLFDFGTDEEKAQLARHKLEGWKQAFRLDKKLQYKLERAEDETKAASEHSEKPAEAPKAEKPKAKASGKSKGKHKSKESEASAEDASAAT